MRLIDADELEKRISEYNTTDITDSILYNFAHSKLISMPTVEDKPQVEEKNICDSCGNTNCIFDSHVARQKCDFYKPQTKTEQFVKWVASEIFDDNWEYNKDAFVELACRKLAKLGIVRAKGDEWELIKPQERSDKE